MEDYLGKMVRQKRPKGKNGECRDTAKVTVVKNGVKKVYSLGRWGSAEAKVAYKKLAVDYYSDSLNLSDSNRLFTLFLRDYWEHATFKHRDPRKHLTSKVIEFANDLFGEQPCSSFSINTITVVKERIVQYARERNLTKVYANQLLSVWKRILIEGILTGWLDGALLPLVKTYPPIADQLKPLKKRIAVSDEVIEQTAKYMTPRSADLVRLIRSACLRPGELRKLKRSNIEVKGDKWVAHIKGKTERFGYPRIIVFTEKEVAILQKWANKEGDVLFNVSPQFINHSIAKAIKKAERRGEIIPHWTAYQLRHAAFTANVKKYGVEVAAKLAGHANLNMAKIYDHSTEDILLTLAENR